MEKLKIGDRVQVLKGRRTFEGTIIVTCMFLFIFPRYLIEYKTDQYEDGEFLYTTNSIIWRYRSQLIKL
jgi:hypothetical protein